MLINTVPIFKSKHPGRSCCRPTLSVVSSLSGGAEVLLQDHPEAAGEHHHHFISGGCWEQTYIYYAALSKADFRHPILLHLGLSKGLSPPIRRGHLPQHNGGVASQDVQDLSYVWALGDVLLLLVESFPWSSLRVSQRGLLSLCPPTAWLNWGKDLS